ncbi:MAG: hypothetical protein ACC633_08065 [Anaerolineales bacterium]
MKKISPILITMAAGYLLMFFSEFVFYGQSSEPGLPPATLIDLGLTYLAYVMMAYVLFSLIRVFRVRSLPALFIAGAAYGWILEGMVVSTIFKELPLNLSFTGLAWHAPIDVVLGLYWIPKLMQKKNALKTSLVLIGMGIFWGFWVLWPWYQSGIPLPLDNFIFFSLGTTILLIPAYRTLGIIDLVEFQPSKGILIGIGLLLMVSFGFNSLLVYPFAALILPILLGSCWWALRKNSLKERHESILSEISLKPRMQNLLLLPLLPISASLTYFVFLSLGWMIPSNVLFGFISSIGGVILFFISLWKIGQHEPGNAKLERTP